MLLLPSVAEARPHHWYTDPKNIFIGAVALAADLYATHEIMDCRHRNDIVHCPDGGYGPVHGREYGVRLGTTITMLGLTIYGREHWTHGWTNELINDSPVILWSGYNVKVGISDRNVPTYPKEDGALFRIKH